MNAMKKALALLLVFALAVSCFPLGSITAFAMENEDAQTSADDSLDPTVLEETSPGTEPPTGTGEAPAEETEPVTGPTDRMSLSAEQPLEEAGESLGVNQSIVLLSTGNPDDGIMPLGGSSGSETGDGGGGGNAAGSGSSNMVAAGLTMQIVYYRYDQCYNRYNSHGSVINTLQNGKALPWNATGKDNDTTATTVFDTFTISP